MKIPTLSASLHSLRKIHYGNQLRPVRDWLVLIVIAVVLLSAGALWNVLEFRATIATKVIVPAAVLHNSIPSSTAMRKVQGIFTARALRQAKYETGSRSFVDPSK